MTGAEWVTVGLAVAALDISWRSLVKSGEANRISHRAVEIAEEQHGHHLEDRAARASLAVRTEPDHFQYPQPCTAYLHCELIVDNHGERAAGRTEVELFAPDFVNNTTFLWAEDANTPGRYSESAGSVTLSDDEGREWGAIRLHRTLDDVPRGVPAEVGFVLAVRVGDVFAVPLRARLRAEHADSVTEQGMSLTLSVGV